MVNNNESYMYFVGVLHDRGSGICELFPSKSENHARQLLLKLVGNKYKKLSNNSYMRITKTPCDSLGDMNAYKYNYDIVFFGRCRENIAKIIELQREFCSD